MNICKYCKNPVVETFYFCPNCGKKIKEPPFKFSLAKAITIIVAAILIPPFGIIPGIKYFLKDDKRAQFIGIITIALTIIATVVMIIFTINFINSFSKTYQEILQSGNMTPAATNDQGELINQIESLE